MTRFRELRARAEARSSDEQAQDHFNRARSAEQLFETASEVLAAARALWNAATDAAIQPHDEPTVRDSAHRLAVRLRTDLPNAVSHDLERLAFEANAEIEALGAEMARNVAAALSAWSARQPAPNHTLLTVLGNTGAGREAKATREALDRFRDMSGRATTPNGVKTLVEAAAKLQTSYAALVATAPEVVREFLESVPSGVSLDELHDEALGWLKKEGVAGSFVVRPQ